jgi:5S rRNA maturation endonuclease (ribonuclease M5)
MVSLIATDNATITKYINNSMKELSNNKLSPKKSTKKIGTTTRTVISFGDTDRVGYDYIQTTSTNKTYIEYTVLVDKADINTDLAPLIEFVEKTTLKRTTSKAQVLNLPAIKLSSKWGIGIIKRIKPEGLSLNILPNSGKYVVEI